MNALSSPPKAITPIPGERSDVPEEAPRLNPEEQALLANANQALESRVGRWVAGLVVPVLLPLSTVISYYLQKWLGFKLSAGSLAAYLGTVVAGVGVAAYKWLANRGQYERALLEIVKLHVLGQTSDA